jgi:predicted AAA+ superfamily ATPase
MEIRENGYSPRLIDSELDELLSGLPAIALEGAKGVGKTATASQRATRIVHLDMADELDAFAASGFALTPDGTLLLDEWQLYPQCWDQVRRSVDAGAPPGSYILAGSVPRPGTRIHSGAGRIVRMRLRPLSLAERDLAEPAFSLSEAFEGKKEQFYAKSEAKLTHYVAEIFASGFPGLRRLPEKLRDLQLDSYITNLVEREFAEQGVNVRRPETLIAWLRAYAAATGTTTSYSNILDSATAGISNKPSRDTTTVYRDVLARTFVLDPLPAWIPVFNPLKRLAASPKHYLADPALAARLLRISEPELLSGTDGNRLGEASMLGALFEHLVVQSLQVYAGMIGAQASHFRQLDGRHEVDVILQIGAKVIAIEAKLASHITDDHVKHLHWLKQQLGENLIEAIVVTTGEYGYRRPDGIAVVPAALLGV